MYFCGGEVLSSSMLLVYETTFTDEFKTYTLERTSETTISTFVDFGFLIALPFSASFRQEELPQTSMSSNTGGGPVHSSTTIPYSGPNPSIGLSERAVAGIGVGAALGVLSLSGFGFLLCHRRSRRRKCQQQGTLEPSDECIAELHNEHKVEMHDETVAAKEMDTPDKAVCVVGNSASPGEMDAPAEVDASVELDTHVKLDVPVEMDAPDRLHAPAKPDLPDLEEGEQL